jgi:hypothetical protein
MQMAQKFFVDSQAQRNVRNASFTARDSNQQKEIRR